MQRVYLEITGRVQGVFFRRSLLKCARELGVVGWVYNNPEGGVTVVAEGEKETLQKLIEWCYHGSSLAQVDNISARWEESTSAFSGFEIR